VTAFEPIAIVGRACVLPGALTPEDLYQAVRAARVLIGPAPDGAWRTDAGRLVRAEAPGPETEYVVSDRGGYVTGFDAVFDRDWFANRVDAPERLDPLVQWLLHCTRTALDEAGVVVPPPGTGFIVGNLSYPTVEHTRFVEDYWLGVGEGAPRPDRAGLASDARNRFSSGGPAHIVANAFGLTGDAFALDAACASSLYAMELACRRLHDRASDLMLAGGVARADPLFIHLGFTALQALSPSGRSRPLHRAADGLLPAEGAGLVVLKRLDDAVRDGDRIHGVIRGIGLSNDGRQSGFLAPDTGGQVRAIRRAYEQAGLSPADVSYVECHATGTLRGDRVELESLSTAWGDGPKPAIGSLKANIGHPITASGAASLLKVLSAFDARELPPTPCDEPLDAIGALGFRLLAEVEPWPSEGPRRAAISNFGFGGNNAHLIVEEWTGAVARHGARGVHAARAGTRAESPDSADPIVICAMGVLAGESVGLPAFVRRLVAPRGGESTVTSEIALPMTGLGFPPKDLQESFPQQTAILAVLEEALGQIPAVDPTRTGVYIGMSVDPEAARHGLRVRLHELLDVDGDGDVEIDIAAWRAANRDSARHLTAAGVLGCMPNIPANRVHAQRDWTAPGFTVASEELSGMDALALAARALRSGDIDAALVGASDFSHEGAHEAAAAAVLPEDRQRPGDAAVALMVMRRSHAEAGGYPVIATLADAPDPEVDEVVTIALAPEHGESEVTARFGHAHAASGLLHVAAGAIAAHLGVQIDAQGAWPAPRRQGRAHTRVLARSFSGREREVHLAAPSTPSSLVSAVDVPVCRFYAAADMDSLAAAAASDAPSHEGAVRLALVAKAEEALDTLRRFAAAELEEGRTPSAPGLFFGEGDVDGEVAFCYTGAAAAYPGAARDLLLAFPQVGHALVARFAGTPSLARDLYGADVGSFSPATQLNGSSFVCQAHTEFTRHVLGIEPQVSLGLSSGETNSLMAFGVWNDLDDMVEEIEASEMYVNQLTGECRSAAAYWGLDEAEAVRWCCRRIAAPLALVEQAAESEPRVYVTVVHHYEDVVICGDADGCARVVEAVGRQRAIDLGLDMVVHCPPLEPFAETWHRIHVRETSAVPGIRFYTNAGNRAYVPTREAAADAITRQALEPIDFPKTIEQAYADGVRVFVEHGPRAIVTGAVRRVLDGRPHVAVALDPHERAGLEQVARTVATLWAAGVPMESRRFTDRLSDLIEGGRPLAEPSGAVLRLRVHPPDIVWAGTAPEGARGRAAPVRGTTSEVSVNGAHTNGTVGQAARAAGSEEHHAGDGGSMPAPPARGMGYDLSRLFGVDRSPTASGGHAAASEPAAATERATTTEPTDAVEPAPVGTAAPASRSGGLRQAAASGDPSVRYFREVAQAHADFLRDQAATHEEFLALGRRLGARVTPAPAASAPPAPPAVPPASALPSHAALPPASDLASAPPATRDPIPPDSPFAPAVPGPTPNLPEPGTVWLTREDLEIHAGGTISQIFGELFEQQDGYERQVRMPEPPLLFADRALTVEGEPGSMKKGRVVTETDVRPDAWYLHAGRMAPGVVIESGQADLLLISWLGADFLNRNDRVYRLLGCDLTFYGELPAPGDTLTYDIHVDGHAKTGDVRLFFFHYDCRIGDRLLISVRNGQAGFFTTDELATSGGVLWSAEDDEPKPDARLDPAPRLTTKRSFSAQEVGRFVAGDAFGCFGEGFELAATHTRTPNNPDGRLRLLDDVPVFDPGGGPWGRGYLKAASHVPTDAWFYDGHFKNDPCMPGTLMADAATQALAFAMTAMGFTMGRDGWRFEPVPGELARFVCRGQVVPDGPHDLEYEVFIEEVVDGDVPEVYAALLCKSDGFKVFGCRRFGLRLVPDYPLTTKREYLANAGPVHLVGPSRSIRGDYEALLACAWGRPSDAFGPMMRKYDGALKCPRLPGPPYHFMSHVYSVDVEANSGADSGTVVSSFDVEPEAWYFAEGGGRMPFAVLAECFLQPCGWFASYLNLFSDTEGDVAFRNLDGDCELHRAITPDIGTLKFTTTLTRVAKAAGTSIVFFDVDVASDDGPVATVTTTFGFFSPKVLEDQRGLPTTDADRARRDLPSPTPVVSLINGGGPLAGLPGMAGGTMRMLDEVTGYWPQGGDAGLGRVRTAQAVRPEAWYFKAHFYEDPVQPGSLGLEALIQSARALVALEGWLDGIEDPVWEQPILGFPLRWRYRGQVVPLRREVVTEVEALEVDVVAGESVTVKVYGTQWVDGLRIYEVPSFAVRVRAAGR
jgi:acyl transferase domain-containing protein/3-hydroxymyristoyl/3-hydroxydecanoyl-(acyl carrier protein) dehydratase